MKADYVLHLEHMRMRTRRRPGRRRGSWHNFLSSLVRETMMSLSAMFGLTLLLFALVVSRTSGIESSDPANSMDCPAQQPVGACNSDFLECMYQPFSCPGSEEVVAFLARCQCQNGQFVCYVQEDLECYSLAPATAAPDTDPPPAPTSSAFFMGTGLSFCLVFIPLIL